MGDRIEKKLLEFSRNRSTISLDELEHLAPKVHSYKAFATLIVDLEEDNILHMVKSQGRNQRTPSVAYKYRINRHALNHTYHQELQTYRLKLHNAINLDAYFNLDYSTWTSDLPYLEKINTYIETNGLPKEKTPAPERSFELVGDEKWLEEKGSDLLQRVKLFEAMNIFPVADPLMFAINPTHLITEQQFHLIVENKTTYQALLPVLTESMFSTLIYGSGNKISKSIENFSDQYPVFANHIFFYFGDIDQSGITIWHSLHKRQPAIPAIPFYERCLVKEKVYGKTNQRPNEEAFQVFSTYFQEQTSKTIQALLHEGAYFPQEVLKTKELQQIWLEADWDAVMRSLMKFDISKEHGKDRAGGWYL